MSMQEIKLEPYISFYGDCEEALNFYKKVFNGNFEIHQRYDNPAMNAPKEFHNKVLHASLQFGSITILASDIISKQKEEAHSSSDVALSLTFPDNEEAQQVFEQLSEGGKVMVPFTKQFWGAWHGNLRDRFGIRWMINS